MSVGSLPYHLRPNKAVDRFLFLELCLKLDPILNLDGLYEYVGFGGPQMEDFRLIHERFPNLPMLCIEGEECVMPRQRFNQPHTMVRFLSNPMRSGEWLSEWNPERPVLLWFDYAIKAERADQYSEFQTLIAAAPANSVIRITINADLPFIKQTDLNERLKLFSRDFEDLLPADTKPTSMVPANFPRLLTQMFGTAAHEVLRHDNSRVFEPLLLTTYRDTSQMLSMTGILLDRGSEKSVFGFESLSTWRYLAGGWDDVRRINLPSLTLKERIYINQLLPNAASATAIQDGIGFQIDENLDASLENLENYREFYRHLPQFARVGF